MNYHIDVQSVLALAISELYEVQHNPVLTMEERLQLIARADSKLHVIRQAFIKHINTEKQNGQPGPKV